jgi:mono/diheme cytochrome c family protein
MRFALKVVGFFAALILSFVLGIHFGFESELTKSYAAKEFQISPIVVAADVKLGQRLYHVRNGCVDCHGVDLSGAMVMDNPAMGTIRGANLTPAALSIWTDEEVARAIRYGIHKSGRSLRFMPSFDFEGLSIEDTAALVAYIRSVPAVTTQYKENRFGPIAKVMSTLGKMPVMFPAKNMDLQKGFAAKPPEGPNVEFGKYLANSCVGCHGSDLKGGKIPGGDPNWPEASNIRLASFPQYTEEAFTKAIKMGVSPISNQELRSPMPIKLLQQMDETEIKALWAYLSTLK